MLRLHQAFPLILDAAISSPYWHEYEVPERELAFGDIPSVRKQEIEGEHHQVAGAADGHDDGLATRRVVFSGGREGPTPKGQGVGRHRRARGAHPFHDRIIKSSGFGMPDDEP